MGKQSSDKHTLANIELTLPKNCWYGAESVRAYGDNPKYLRLIDYQEPDHTLYARYARPVAYIQYIVGDSLVGGTGFLVAPDLLLTNHHVLPSPELAKACKVFFNFVIGEPAEPRGVCGRPSGACAYYCDVDGPNGLYVSSPVIEQDPINSDNMTALVDADHLDYTLVRVNKVRKRSKIVDAMPGDDWGYVPIVSNPTNDVASTVTIIQHPVHNPTYIGAAEGEIRSLTGLVVQYATTTAYGSSGAPVFNEGWELVALHHAAGNLSSGAPGNEGIDIAAILKDLAKRCPEVNLPPVKKAADGWPEWPKPILEA